MSRAIDNRKASVLGSQYWKTTPWQYFAKDSLQQLFDFGFELAALLELANLIKDVAEPAKREDRLEQLSSGHSTLLQSLNQWFGVHWTARMDVALRGRMPDIPNAPGRSRTFAGSSPDFESMWEASNIVFYWYFTLVLNDITLILIEAEYVQSPESVKHGPSQNSEPRSVAPVLSTREELSDSSLDLAINILVSRDWFLSGDTGWLGPQRLFFPLKRAMSHLLAVRSPLGLDAREAFFKLIARLKNP